MNHTQLHLSGFIFIVVFPFIVRPALGSVEMILLP